jgi:hypothetical protein
MPAGTAASEKGLHLLFLLSFTHGGADVEFTDLPNQEHAENFYRTHPFQSFVAFRHFAPPAYGSEIKILRGLLHMQSPNYTRAFKGILEALLTKLAEHLRNKKTSTVKETRPLAIRPQELVLLVEDSVPEPRVSLAHPDNAAFAYTQLSPLSATHIDRIHFDPKTDQQDEELFFLLQSLTSPEAGGARFYGLINLLLNEVIQTLWPIRAQWAE